MEEVVRHRRHPPLVLFPRAVHVEVAEAHDGGGAIGQHPAHVLVEQELRVAVDVERSLVLALLDERGAAAVHRRARRVEEGNVVVLAMVEQRHRVAVVVAQHVAAVALHRVGARALVQDRRDVVVEIALRQAAQELVLVEVVGDLDIDQVANLVGARQVVDRDDVGLAARVQPAHQVRSDEAGGAGDDDVHDQDSAVGCTLIVRGRGRRARLVTCGTRGATAHSNS